MVNGKDRHCTNSGSLLEKTCGEKVGLRKTQGETIKRCGLVDARVRLVSSSVVVISLLPFTALDLHMLELEPPTFSLIPESSPYAEFAVQSVRG